ncbi:MAG: S8 family serine peptidase [Oligoflexales bacterium]|nr:S8 family serine peptidase [Oligoflexales bacterium]
MNRLYFVFLLAVASLSLSNCGNKELDVDRSTKKNLRVPGSYILGLRLEHEPDPLRLMSKHLKSTHLSNIEYLGKTPLSLPLEPRYKSISDRDSALEGSLSLFRVDLKSGVQEWDFLDSLDYDSIVIWEPNRINELFTKEWVPVSSPKRPSLKPKSKIIQDQNFFSDLYDRYQDLGGNWWLDSIRVGELYQALGQRDLDALPDASLGDLAPVIAILDSGIDFLHPALRSKIWLNPNPGQSGCENDEYGCDTTLGASKLLGQGPAVPFGTQFAGEPCPVETIQGQTFLNGACIHGTHVAGLIVADDAYGVAGVCPHCKILSIKVVENIDGEGKVPDSAILKGLKYVQNINKMHGGIVKLVNSSFGKFEQSRSVSLVVKELMNHGVVVVGASGNENTSERVFPAALEDVIAVTALSREGRKASYANFGSWISLAAPGGDVEIGSRSDEAIISTVPGGDVYLSQGTSVATPLVTGVAGLIQMLEPGLQAQNLKYRLLASADRKLYDMDFADGYNQSYGPKYGREPIPGQLGRGILDGLAAYLGESRWDHEPPQTQRVSPNCGEITVENGAAGHSFLFLIFLYLMPIILLGVRRRGVR